jgi:hypothetical protein
MAATKPVATLGLVEAVRFVSGRLALDGQRAGIMRVKIKKSTKYYFVFF